MKNSFSRFSKIPKSLRISEANAFSLDVVASELGINIGRLIDEILFAVMPWFETGKPPEIAIKHIPILRDYLEMRERGDLKKVDLEAIAKRIEALRKPRK